MRDVVDALVALVDTEKASCCGWVDDEMEAADT
jgi:hypothetical protein